MFKFFILNLVGQLENLVGQLLHQAPMGATALEKYCGLI